MTAAADHLGGLPLARTDGSAARALRIGVTPAVRRRPSLALVVPVRSDARRAPFVAVVVCLLAAGLLGLLVLNTVAAQDAFVLHTLDSDARQLADREQTLRREVEQLRAPDALAARAAELGMVQVGPPAFLRLSDGAILGSVAAGIPAPVPVPAPAPGAAPATAVGQTPVVGARP